MSSDPSGIPPDLPPDLLGRIPLFAELQKVLSWTGGPVNWDLAKQIAVASAAASEATHGIDAAAEQELAEDGRVAELWLSQATPLSGPPSLTPPRALTPARWAERACDAYRELVDPLAAKVSAAFGEQAAGALPEGALPPGMDPSMLGQAIRQMGPLLLGVQAGGLIGGVAKDLLGEHDLPVPSDDAGAIAVVLPNVDRLASEYDIDRRQLRLWVTLHETAHRAIFESIGGARSLFWARYLDYVASLSVDFTGLMERLGSLDLTNPGALEGAAADEGFFAMFDAPSTPQSAALEHLIALVEALADRAVATASEGLLPAAPRIAEAVMRHQSGTDGAAAIRRFVGIGGGEEARRNADRFTRAVLERSGWDALVRMWEDHELFPSPAEASDPDSWIRRTTR